MKFENEEHEAVFEEICDRMKSCRNTQCLNGYHLAVAYLFALTTSCIISIISRLRFIG